MTLEKPTLIIFDMDGTTVRHINPKILHILEKIDDFMFFISESLGGSRQNNLIDPNKPQKKRRLLVHRALHKMRRKKVEQIVEPCPGVRDVLKLIRAYQIPTAIVSNGLGTGYGHDILEKFDLEKYFDAQIFREDFIQSKPNPEPLLNAVKKLNRTIIPNDVIWVIGDRKKDIKAAIKLGEVLSCKVEPISYGIEAAIAVLKYQISADHILTTYHDLEQKLVAVCGEPPLHDKPSNSPSDSNGLAA
jgi:phosphoglycolate phosphatase